MPQTVDSLVASMTNPSGRLRAVKPHVLAAAEALKARHSFIDRVFASAAAFDRYKQARPHKAALTQAIERTVAGMASVVAEIEANGQDDDELRRLSQQSADTQYRVLVTRGYLDPATLLDDVPEAATLCELGEISKAVKAEALTMSNAELSRQWTNSMALFANRWQRITGRPFDGGQIPRVGELTLRKAPIPLSPAWTDRLYAREAGALNAEPDHANGAAAAIAPSVETSTELIETEADEAELEHRTSCDANAVMERVGVPPLRPPAANQPRYSFPGQLLQREDIFYDFAVIAPVDECGPFGPETTDIERRSLAAANIAAGEALGIIAFLDGLSLSEALGTFPAGGPVPATTVIDTVKQLILDLLNNVDVNTPTLEMRRWKRRFSEVAGLIRSAARRQLFLGRLAGQDPRDFLNDLSAALASLPPYSTYLEDTIAYNPVPEGQNLSTYLMINGLGIGNVRDVHGTMSIDERDQVRNLRVYLEYLGNDFYNNLRTLERAAINMRDAVQSFQGSASQVQADFQNMAAGKINEAAHVLARLLDDIAEYLPVWTQRLGDGSKRLALLMIYRQYWTPEGYVKGKLVGYKNLIPAQKEKIRQRTFIQTTSERSTVQEFAASRQQDFSQSQKETAELLRENSLKFGMTSSASGGFSFAVASLDIAATSAFEMASMSRTTQSSIAEMTMKSAFSYNEKREVKIRQETQVREEFESELSLENTNQEITANYFYYQLLRQYLVTVQLHDIRPVLLRTRYGPPESAIDDKFLADHAHVLVHALPAQLASDLEASVSRIDALARKVLRAQNDLDAKNLAYIELRSAPTPATPEDARDRENKLASLRDAVNSARESLDESDEEYLATRSRLDRVAAHVRQNIYHYMQFIWQASPSTDDDMLLRTETFHGTPLPQITRGLQRQGFYGDEEIFDYTGESVALSEALLRTLTPGSEIAALTDEALRATALFQQLSRQYSDAEIDDLIEAIHQHAFVTDPAGAETVLSSRRVQVAQDALVVETLPGQVPLLEGYKMAHRMLDIERACLENRHLAERIRDRPWTQNGEDSYRIYRREGEPIPRGEEDRVAG